MGLSREVGYICFFMLRQIIDILLTSSGIIGICLNSFRIIDPFIYFTSVTSRNIQCTHAFRAGTGIDL